METTGSSSAEPRRGKPRKARESYRLKILPPEAPQRVDGTAASLKYVQAIFGVPSDRLARALGRLIKRGGPFHLPRQLDNGMAYEYHPITPSEIMAEASAHDADVESFKHDFDERMTRLLGRAQAEDESAIILILHLAAKCVASLESLRKVKLAWVREIAAKTEDWPFMINPTSDWQESIEGQLEDLNVGREFDSPFDMFKVAQLKQKLKPGSREKKLKSIADDLVIRAVHDINHVREILRTQQIIRVLVPPSKIRNRNDAFWKSKLMGLSMKAYDSLPDLDKSDAAQRDWYSALRAYVLYVYDGKPEEDEELSQLGKSGANKGETKVLRPKGRATAIRNTIWDRLRKSLADLSRPRIDSL